MRKYGEFVGLGMKAKDLTKEHFDEIFKQCIEGRGFARPLIISTREIARRLWFTFRVPIRKEVDVVRQKMRAWWNSYPWLSEPRIHKMICGVAVFLSSPMAYDYCALERPSFGVIKSLICVYSNQKEFKKRKN